MLAVVCLVFAAVGERLAISDGDRTSVQDASVWEWFSTSAGRHDSTQPTGEITYPRRLVQQIESEEEIVRESLDTRVKNGTVEKLPVHLAQISFQVAGFGHTFTLDLELNHHLLSSEYIERHFNDDGKPLQSVGGEHCYYQGRLRGLPGSWAALSTCHGLCGMFSDGFFSYGIEPVRNGSHQEDGAHTIHRLPDFRLTPHCPGCAKDSKWRGDGVEEDKGEKDRPDQTISAQSSKGLIRRKRHVRRPSVQAETKYIELMVVNDYDLFVQLRRSTTQTKNFAKAVVNMADAMYKEQLNTRIVLVAMETWSSENKMEVSADPLATLGNFMKYRRDSVREQSDVVHVFSGRTFESSRSGTAYTGGVCSQTRGGGINEYGNVGSMAVTLCQSLGQNIGMRWNNARSAAGDCRCPDAWLGCIMEDTGYYLPRKFSRCSMDEYSQFLLQGGGSCLFNNPNKLLDPPECGNGFVEPGEECDCGSQVECARNGGACCKKCTLTHDAMCSNGLCCSGCRYELRGAVCRDAVNDCDIPETCTGDSSQCPHNVHKLDGYMCDSSQGRCYAGRCRTRDAQCKGLWGYNSADRFCYEKLNAEGTEKGNCGPGTDGKGWLQCNKPDVLCGFLFCANLTVKPKFGDLQGDVTSLTIYHQNKYLDCRGGHALLEDGSDLGYVEAGTPCGPNMMCLEHRCLPLSAFNLSSCAGSSHGLTCSHHGTCSNEVKCICDRDYTGKDCSVFDPIPEPTAPAGLEKKGTSGEGGMISHPCLCFFSYFLSHPIQPSIHPSETHPMVLGRAGYCQIWRRIRRRLLSLSSCLSVPHLPHTFVPALEKREIGGTSFTLLSYISPCLFIYCPPIPSLGPVQPGSTVNLEGGRTLYISLLEHQPIIFLLLLSADQPWHRTQVPSPKKDSVGFFCKTFCSSSWWLVLGVRWVLRTPFVFGPWSCQYHLPGP